MGTKAGTQPAHPSTLLPVLHTLVGLLSRWPQDWTQPWEDAGFLREPEGQGWDGGKPLGVVSPQLSLLLEESHVRPSTYLATRARQGRRHRLSSLATFPERVARTCPPAPSLPLRPRACPPTATLEPLLLSRGQERIHHAGGDCLQVRPRWAVGKLPAGQHAIGFFRALFIQHSLEAHGHRGWGPAGGPGPEGAQYPNVAVEAEGWHEDPVHVAEGRGALLLPIDEEGQSVLIQVQQHAHGGPLAHTTFCPGERSRGGREDRRVS